MIWPRFVEVTRGDWEERARVPAWKEKRGEAKRIAYRSGGIWIDRGEA